MMKSNAPSVRWPRLLACWTTNLGVRHNGYYCAVGRFDDDDSHVKDKVDDDPRDACILFLETALLRHISQAGRAMVLYFLQYAHG